MTRAEVVRPAPRGVAAVGTAGKSDPDADLLIFKGMAGQGALVGSEDGGGGRLHVLPGRGAWVGQLDSPGRDGLPLAAYAAAELAEAGITINDPELAQALVSTAAVFASFPGFDRGRHSLDAAVHLLGRLLRRQPLGQDPLAADGWAEDPRTKHLQKRLEGDEYLLEVAHRGAGELSVLLEAARVEHESQQRVRSALLGMVTGLARAHGVTGWIDERGGAHPMDEPVPAGELAVGPKGQLIMGVDAAVSDDVDQVEETEPPAADSEGEPDAEAR